MVLVVMDYAWQLRGSSEKVGTTVHRINRYVRVSLHGGVNCHGLRMAILLAFHRGPVGNKRLTPVGTRTFNTVYGTTETEVTRRN